MNEKVSSVLRWRSEIMSDRVDDFLCVETRGFSTTRESNHGHKQDIHMHGNRCKALRPHRGW